MLSKIISLLSSGLLKVLGQLLSAVSSIFKYLYISKKDKIEKEKEEKRQEENEKIDDVCNKGSLNDLINLGVK